MHIAPTIARIDDQVVVLRNHVAGAAEFEAAKESIAHTPAAFVLPLRELAKENEQDTGVLQRTSVRFGVLLAVRNVRDARGAASSQDLKALRASVFTALLGWAPTADHDPVTYAAGQIMLLSKGVLWWQDEFITAYYVRA